MLIEIIKQIPHFHSIKVPRYIIEKIQRCALSHLNLKDMGKLRDRMEGQLYYDKLKRDILAEFAFENLVVKKSFDWERRMEKKYRRKTYNINNSKISLITFNPNNIPKISLEHTKLSVWIWVKDDSKVLISGLATSDLIKLHGSKIKDNIYQLKKFENLIPFGNKEEFQEVLELEFDKT